MEFSGNLFTKVEYTPSLALYACGLWYMPVAYTRHKPSKNAPKNWFFNFKLNLFVSLMSLKFFAESLIHKHISLIIFLIQHEEYPWFDVFARMWEHQGSYHDDSDVIAIHRILVLATALFSQKWGCARSAYRFSFIRNSHGLPEEFTAAP